MGAACSLPTQEMPTHLPSTHVWRAPSPSVHREASAWQSKACLCTCPFAPEATGGLTPRKSSHHSPGGPHKLRLCQGGRRSRPESQTPSTNSRGKDSFLWTPVAFCRGAGSGTPHGCLVCVLDTQLWLTHSFTSLSAYPGTEVRRLCVIRK